jgi:dihydrofolate reductase
LNLIVAVDLNWGIGHAGGLLVSLREDMKRFKDMTIGQVVVLGRKTLATFPGGKPLPGRTNVILTHQPDFSADGAIICHSLDALISLLADYPDESIYLIGGSSLYEQLLPYCRLAYVTRIKSQYPADAFFPDLDQMPGWHLVSCGPELVGTSRIGDTSQPVPFVFCLYQQDFPRRLIPPPVLSCEGQIDD